MANKHHGYGGAFGAVRPSDFDSMTAKQKAAVEKERTWGPVKRIAQSIGDIAQGKSELQVVTGALSRGAHDANKLQRELGRENAVSRGAASITRVVDAMANSGLRPADVWSVVRTINDFSKGSRDPAHEYPFDVMDSIPSRPSPGTGSARYIYGGSSTRSRDMIRRTSRRRINVSN